MRRARRSRLLPTFGCLVVLLVLPAPGARPDASAEGGSGWSEREKRILASLALGDIDHPPASPSNRVADHAGAAELGRRLFFDPRLSRNGEIACATCHRPELYFTDGQARSHGLGTTLRNAPTVVGSAFQSWFYWDGRRESLWSQALIPLEAADEMGGSRVAVVRLLGGDDGYLAQYRAVFGEAPPDVEAFGENAGPLGDEDERAAWERQPEHARSRVNRAFANAGKALESFERTLMPPPTRFDRYVARLLAAGEEAAAGLLDPQEIAGARLFLDDRRTRCLRCHNGPMFTNGSFHNIGTGNFEGERLDFGRAFGVPAVRMTEFNCLGPHSDASPDECLELRFLSSSPHVPLEGAFKVPSLRNVAATAPYLHDGSLPTLEAVLAHYRRPPAEGRAHELQALDLEDDEASQLLAFLRCLSP